MGKSHYRIKEIQPRHFYQAGQKAGLREDDLDDIFANPVPQIDFAIAEVRDLAVDEGVPETRYEPMLADVKKQAGLINQYKPCKS